MKRAILSALAVLTFSSPAYAIPTLQLGIAGGSYVNETTVSYSQTFDLYAYLLPNDANTTSDTYYLSAALIKSDYSEVDNTASDLGSFKIGSQTYNVTSGMIYGTPPADILYGDIQKHSVFPTYFVEQSFQFSDAEKLTTAINVENGETQAADQYFRSFLVDLSDLADGYGIHFDLYNLNAWESVKKGMQYDVSEIAPFSHDAEGIPTTVPEPATMMLLGAGFLGLAIYSKRRKKV